MLTPDEHRIASALRDNPMGLGEVHAPAVVYDLPHTPLQAVLAALRGGDRAPVAVVVAGVVLVFIALAIFL
jgi:hypothetical protein